MAQPATVLYPNAHLEQHVHAPAIAADTPIDSPHAGELKKLRSINAAVVTTDEVVLERHTAVLYSEAAEPQPASGGPTYPRKLLPQTPVQYSSKTGDFAKITGGWVLASNLVCSCSSAASAYSSNANARTIAAYLMEHEGVSDPAAIAVILGNIQQESSFNPLACQAGGVGILQWSGSRRNALLAKSNPDSLATQLAFLVAESDWTAVRDCFRTQGKAMGSPSDAASSTGSYWACSRKWIRWGTAGSRGTYANNWLKSC
eukprot:m51a1_g9199 hypothetical protein (259) ;mRNA; f:104538-106785